jgi:hypothetical protein
MQLNKTLLFILSIFVSFLIQNSIDGSIYEFISVFLMTYYLLRFVDSIGTKYNINQITILFGIFQLLIMPMVVYRLYNENKTTIALFYNMSVEETQYYEFMIPAILLMILGIEIPLIRNQRKEIILQNAIPNVKKYLQGKSIMGIVLMAIGLSTGILEPFIGSEFRYILYLFSKLLFVGIFYVLFSQIRNKNIYLFTGVAALLIQTIIQGMFGELIYTSVLGFILLMLGRKKTMSFKLTLVIAGAFLVLVLQSIKVEYRAIAWNGIGQQGVSNTEVFFALIIDRISDPSLFLDKEKNFPMVVRFNQGMIQDKVMSYVPRIRPYAEGETIFNSLAASFVPRFLWPDKPMAGGHWNMEYFTGLTIEGYSMNIGPFGEAYGNFGTPGGIYFMFFYGLFFNLAIYFLLRIAKTRPTIILWFPIIFLNAIQVETDILMTVNSVIKNCLFVAFCYWAADRFMRIQL